MLTNKSTKSRPLVPAQPFTLRPLKARLDSRLLAHVEDESYGEDQRRDGERATHDLNLDGRGRKVFCKADMLGRRLGSRHECKEKERKARTWVTKERRDKSSSGNIDCLSTCQTVVYLTERRDLGTGSGS